MWSRLRLRPAGLSAVHRQYLAAGGTDFLIGDGALNYAPECVWESYYQARLAPGFFAAFDVQRDSNPAYNQDRRTRHDLQHPSPHRSWPQAMAAIMERAAENRSRLFRRPLACNHPGGGLAGETGQRRQALRGSVRHQIADRHISERPDCGTTQNRLPLARAG